MLKLISKETTLNLMSFPVGKKVAFLLLLYERMLPALISFRRAEGLGLSVFQDARAEFWRSLVQGAAPVSWARLRDDILKSIPDTEDFGSRAASFALDTGLVAADIAGLLQDGRDIHIVEAMKYALDSLDAYVLDQMGIVAFDRSSVASIHKFVDAHALVQKERQREEQDVALLCAMPDTPWSEDIVAMLLDRAAIQGSLFEDSREGSQLGANDLLH
jgi:uncharacterized protein YjaG (DUF416 family)